jgi:uncharacterized membrane protein
MSAPKHSPGVLAFVNRPAVRATLHVGANAGLGVLVAHVCFTVAVLYIAGRHTDFTALRNVEAVDAVLRHRPTEWVTLLAGLLGAGLAMVLVPGDLRERLRRARRALLVVLAAGAVATLFMLFSPHARLGLVVVLSGVGGLLVSPLAVHAGRGTSRLSDRALPWVIFVGSTAFYFYFSDLRHSSFGSGSWDYGCYNHSVWLASRFKPLLSTVLGDVQVIGDHWIPIIYVLAPVFWVTDSSSALLFVQAALVCSIVFPIYWLTRREEMSRLVGAALALVFLFSLPVQSAIDFDFHETTIATCFLAYALYFIETRRPKASIPFLILLALCKESMPLYVSFLGLYAALFRGHRLFGAVLFVIGITSFLVIIKWIMPALLEGSSQGMIHMRFDSFGSSLGSALSRMAEDPLRTAVVALSPAVKMQTLLLTLGSFVFLALLAPRFLVVGAVLVAERFLVNIPSMWTMGYHYGGPLTLLVAVASVFGARRALEPLAGAWARLAGWRPAADTVAAFLGISCLGATFLIDGWGRPSEVATLATFRKPYYSKHVATNRRAVAVIPPGVSVAAQHHLLPHVAMREKVWRLHRPIRAEYVLMNPDDGAWPFDRGYVVGLIKELLAQGYRAIFSEGMSLVLRRNAPTSVPLSPHLQQALR